MPSYPAVPDLAPVSVSPNDEKFFNYFLKGLFCASAAGAGTVFWLYKKRQVSLLFDIGMIALNIGTVYFAVKAIKVPK